MIYAATFLDNFMPQCNRAGLCVSVKLVSKRVDTKFSALLPKLFSSRYFINTKLG